MKKSEILKKVKCRIAEGDDFYICDAVDVVTPDWGYLLGGRMKLIEADCGELAYNVLKRAKEFCKDFNEKAVRIRHNCTEITVYRDSDMQDLCEKFDMQTLINRCKEGYTR